MTRLLLLDATNLGHRLFHARDASVPLPERFGFALNRWRRHVQPEYAVAVFDGPGEGWRSKLWPAYKARRNTDPSSRPSATDWQRIQAACRANGIAVACREQIEADDLIASYTTAAVRQGLRTSIVTSDKDMLQLVREELAVAVGAVHVIDPGSGASRSCSHVRDDFGVWPHAIPDLLALAGDPTDGYPGVKGIGRKTAALLLEQHGDVEQIIDRAQLLPGKHRDRVLAQVGDLRLFRRLATLVDDLALPVPLKLARWER